ncbi:hypothetical protein O7599_18610 [Streptomyces sp. WMMC500]|uniref:hypothetical protein n=1 Tax=Streptomyces sp. WMMC500 TaxID=3015154 RepID=UPI00248C8968|nr:hypothetical protein [Streptomyces sp. WMMC500]WBB57700.1 hypothetical protein O7599_18610 [Streptomyces sp. WMMC500]
MSPEPPGPGEEFLPAAERPWRDAWPAVARAGDGNAWVRGVCWLFCRREGVAVVWVGSVITPGAGGEMYACGSCIAELDHMVRRQAHAHDRRGHRAARYATLTLPPHAPPPRALPTGRHLAAVGDPAEALPRRRDPGSRTEGCTHPRTEKRDGKTYCRDCDRQLYL